MGDSIIDGLAQEGIKTDMMLRSPGPSPFTYIIVDRSGGTRTCIHTPGPDCPASDIEQSEVDAVLEGASLLYFDGRLTQAAVVVAKAAKRYKSVYWVSTRRYIVQNQWSLGYLLLRKV